MSEFGSSVDEDHDRIKVVRLGELDDSIHGDRLPRTLGNGERLEGTIGLVSICFGSSTSLTTCDIFVHELTLIWPVIVPCQKIKRSSLSKMASSWRIVSAVTDVEFELMVVGDKEEISETDQVITEVEILAPLLNFSGSGPFGVLEIDFDRWKIAVILLGNSKTGKDIRTITKD
jgi:hypothetical protein